MSCVIGGALVRSIVNAQVAGEKDQSRESGFTQRRKVYAKAQRKQSAWRLCVNFAPLREKSLAARILPTVSYRFPWHQLSDEQLLDLRICDLPIKIKGSFLEPHIKRLYGELNS